ncbi:acyl carrier protein [Streptomyces sioyaensis]|uniref:acyl carrier protein n=1 Tax=Streptomyces sioyaensis TaxID=67364 RepID=UPI0037A8C5BE
MTAQAPPTRNELVELLASYGDRPPGEVPDRVDSLELAWIIHSMEERYDVELDLDDGQLARMVTLDSVLDVLAATLGGEPHDRPAAHR